MILRRNKRPHKTSAHEEPLHASESGALAEDPMQFMWAISYSDLLMVLMSFFVIYFEMRDNVDVMSSLAQKARPTAVTAPKEKIQEPIQEEVDEEVVERNLLAIKMQAFDSLALKIQDPSLSVSRDSVEPGVYVNFKNNFYREGSYDLNKAARASVLRILMLVHPQRNEIELTFIGHSDAVPISHKTIRDTKVLDSNFVLSSLRATKAMEFAMSNGFDPRFISAQGSGEYARSTRSLSVRISARKSKEAKE
ncbi:hypothetical protein WDW37_18810 [Bdellovibrionota bacterium FG-1]